MATIDSDLIRKIFPILSEKELLTEIEKEGHLMTVEAGDRIISYGSYIRTIPLIISGSIRVMRPDAEGRELLLYYLQQGDTCAMSLNGCVAGDKSTINADAIEQSTLIGIPVQLLDSWTIKYNSWRSFILGSYAKRFNELLKALDDVAFSKLDDRLIKYLNEKADITDDRVIHISHSDIAKELHSSREVISRLLKKMENDGLILMGRNKISLRSISA